MPISLTLDILVAILLVVFIVYAMVLNRKLGLLRRDKTELEKLATTFGDSTLRAEDSIRNLKTTADDLQARIAKAQALADDLAFLIDRGSSAADRLEETVRVARDASPKPPQQTTPAPETPLADDITGQTAPAPTPEKEVVHPDVKEPPTLSPPRLDDGFDDADGRSDAERALLKALRTAR